MSVATQPQAAAPPAQGPSLPERVVQHIQVSNTALEKASAFEQAHRHKQAQVEALIPQVVDTMVQHERITPNQREKLAEMLKDPAKVLELMVKVAGHRNTDEIARLGSGVDPNTQGQVKTAAANGQGNYDPAQSVNDPNVGVPTTRVKQSSVNLFKGLGLDPGQA